MQSDGVRLSQLDPQQVSELQRALKEAGYYTAEIDGIAGPKTKRALQDFYVDQAKLASQGLIMPRGAAVLGLEGAEIERVRGEDSKEPVETEEIEPMPEDADEPDTTRPPEPSSPTPAPGAPNPGPPTMPGSHGSRGTSPY